VNLVTCHLSLVTLLHSSLVSLSAAEPLAKGIQDNSFFVEEAYNQEPGVIQHILNVPVFFADGEKEITPSFTQEWPVFSQTHQFSYTIPHTFAEHENGFEDIRLNYRLQALMESDRTPAFAPRFSLVTPSGDADEGFGHDRLGYEVNLPFSKIVSDRWTVHFNAGRSVFPDVNDRVLSNYNLGGSAIYAVNANFNLMLESVAFWEEDVADPAERRAAPSMTNEASTMNENGTSWATQLIAHNRLPLGAERVDLARKVDRSVTALLSPGARYGFNLPNDAQLVAGIAVPIGLTSDSPDYGLFFYCSFEHPFTRVELNKTK
jgi:hypothetical protein